MDFDWEGFEWIVPDDHTNNTVVFLRKDRKGRSVVVRGEFFAGGTARLSLRRAAEESSTAKFSIPTRRSSAAPARAIPCPVKTEWIPAHGHPCSIAVTIPPLSGMVLRGEGYLRAPRKLASGKRPRRAESAPAARASGEHE